MRRHLLALPLLLACTPSGGEPQPAAPVAPIVPPVQLAGSTWTGTWTSTENVPETGGISIRVVLQSPSGSDPTKDIVAGTGVLGSVGTTACVTNKTVMQGIVCGNTVTGTLTGVADVVSFEATFDRGAGTASGSYEFTVSPCSDEGTVFLVNVTPAVSAAPTARTFLYRDGALLLEILER